MKKDILKHCQDKAEEYRNKNLSILDDDFDVLIYDICFELTVCDFVRVCEHILT